MASNSANSLTYWPLSRRTGWGLLVAAVIGWAFYQAGIGRSGAELINWDGLNQLAQFFAAGLRPEVTPEFLAVIGRATLVTFAYAVCGTTLSLLLGCLGGIFSAAVVWKTLLPASGRWGWLGPPVWLSLRALLAVPRAIHELIWGLFFLNILGLDPLVAVLAIAIPFGAIVAKVFAEILDETSQAPLQALLGAGVPPLAALLYGLMPQAFSNLLSYSFYRFECSLRSAAVLGVIGAGGLGYEILLSLQSLRYEQLWTGFYALMLLNGLVDTGSAFVRRRLKLTSRLDLNAQKSAALQTWPANHAANSPWLLRLLVILATLSVPLCFWGLNITWSHLWAERTRRLLGEVLAAAIPTTKPDTWINLLQLSLATVAMAIVAIVLAGLGGILFSFLTAQNIWLPGGLLRPEASGIQQLIPRLTWLLSRLLLLISRAIPAPIWALVCLFVLYPGILPGALALGIHNFGILGRLMGEVNENLNEQPIKALRSLGASGPQLMLYGILPQNLGRFLAYILYRWEVCTRETVIVGLVGAGGLGRLLTEQISSFDYGGVSLTLLAFLVLTFGVDMVSHRLRDALR